MKARKLTAKFVENERRPGVYPDINQGGLCLLIHPSGRGRKSWIIRYRHPISGVSRKLTLDPLLTLEEAREASRDAGRLRRQKIDPIEHKRTEMAAAANSAEGTVQATCERYMELEGRKLRSHAARTSILQRHIYPRLGSIQVHELRRTDVVAALDVVEREGKPRAADMALGVLRRILHWHEIRNETFKSPLVPGMSRVKAKERIRKRILNDDELRKVWNACNHHRMGVFGKAMQFALLTGCRKTEATALRRSEIQTMRDNGGDFTVWRLPAARSKNGEEIIRPLGAAALSLIEAQPKISEGTAVFTFNGHTPIAANTARKKEELDRLSGVYDWVIHDLRRTHDTLLSRLRVPRETRERMLGHSQPFLDQTYNQDASLAAMLDAYDGLAAEIERIVSGRTAKVLRPSFKR
jgi:integrase